MDWPGSVRFPSWSRACFPMLWQHSRLNTPLDIPHLDMMMTVCGHPRVKLCLARGGGGELVRVGPVPILVKGWFPDVVYNSFG